MKVLKLVKLTIVWIMKVISVVVVSLGALGTVYLIGKVSYLVATQTQEGIFEMLNSDMRFLSQVMFISICMLIIGAFGFLKTTNTIKRIKISLR